MLINGTWHTCDDGEFSALVEPEVLDMSVLGRDIMDMFAVVVDRPRVVVALLGANHRYRIEVAGT